VESLEAALLPHFWIVDGMLLLECFVDSRISVPRQERLYSKAAGGMKMKILFSVYAFAILG
jgi:hypothetical protein